jgi:type II secretory pathway component GspD/PulD (secretin)
MPNQLFQPLQPCWMKQGLSLALSVSLLLGNVLPVFSANPDVLTGDVRVTVNPANIKASLPIPGASRKVSMSLHGISIQDALRALGKKGGFNVLIDESVTGDISVDLNNVTIQDALETIKSYGHLAYSLQGNNLMVAEATSEKGQSFRKSTTRIFPLHNANARVVADILNNTLFSDVVGNTSGAGVAAPTGGGTGNPVTADFHTNSLIVVGEPKDILAVQKHLEVLDKPKESKTWRLSHANALDVATILASSVFNEGIPVLNAGSTGTSTTTGTAVGGTSTSVRAVAENVQDGAGSSQATQSGGNSGGGGGTASTATVNTSVTLRTKIKAMQNIGVSAAGPIILPDTRLNTLTLMGTAEQIAMAEAMIPTLDRKVPQVVLETSLVEISETGGKELGFNFGFNNGGFSLGSNNSSNVGIQTDTSSPLENVLQWSTSPRARTRNFYYQLNALITQQKAKMLANPTIITANDNEAVVSIVDEIVRSVTLTRSALTAPTATVNIGEAGIVLNLLPKIGADGTINLRVRPVISTVADTKSGLGGVVTLLSKREVLTQNVQLKDGETFVLGGLVQNTNKDTVYRNPALANLPILGALARNSVSSKHRTELVVLITPHIMDDESSVTQGMPGKPGSGMVPATMTGHKADRNILPVSWNGETHSNALPALQKPHVINSMTHGQDPLDNKDQAQPSPRPSGALLPDEMRAAPVVAKKSTPESSSMVPVSYRPETTSARSQTPHHAVVQAPAPADTSDAAIRAIMEKFK